MSTPSVLIPVAPGTNRDRDLALAFALAGAHPVVVPISAIRDGDVKVADHPILAVAGGFSYGDALGAGHLLALDAADWTADWMADQAAGAADRDHLVFGVCNGFQALVAAGLLPGRHEAPAALRHNERHQFECRWVTLVPDDATGPWLDGLDGPLRCPVAHGEGRFVADDPDALAGQVAFRYADSAYPANPNGSTADIAGVTDPTGRIIGLMPHPENHVLPTQDPLAGRAPGGLCLPLFRNAIRSLT